MTAKEYVRKSLEILIGKFPHVRVRYEHDRMAEVHVIEVVPNEVYRLDDAYIQWEEKTTDEFIDLFPTQNICFISDDALVGIRNAEYVLEGLTYAPLSVDPSLSTSITPIKIADIHTISAALSIVTVTVPVKQDNNVFFGDYFTTPSSSYQLAA